jgi:hypothetical protein
MISVRYFFSLVFLSSQESVRSEPSTYTLEPFFTYSATISAVRCHAFTLCHSVRSCHSPALSLKRSLVAMLKAHTAVPLGVYFSSGSRPTFPTRMTLFTLLAIQNSSNEDGCPSGRPHYTRTEASRICSPFRGGRL